MIYPVPRDTTTWVVLGLLLAPFVWDGIAVATWGPQYTITHVLRYWQGQFWPLKYLTAIAMLLLWLHLFPPWKVD